MKEKIKAIDAIQSIWTSYNFSTEIVIAANSKKIIKPRASIISISIFFYLLTRYCRVFQ